MVRWEWGSAQRAARYPRPPTTVDLLPSPILSARCTLTCLQAAVAARIWSDDPKQPLNPAVALAAIAACAALAESISLSEKMASHGIVQKLVKLLTWQDSYECAVAASSALAIITGDGRGGNCVKLAESDPGLAKVTGLLQSDNPVQLTSAARILRNLAITPLSQVRAPHARSSYLARVLVHPLSKCGGAAADSLLACGPLANQPR